MRFVAVAAAARKDGSDVDAAALVDDAVARAEGADRLLLFGEAAAFAARRARAERDAREGQWLEAAAAWLLDADDGDVARQAPEPPARPADAPLKKATAIVPVRTDLVGVARSDRVLELCGGLIVMAVPDDAAVFSGDGAVDNAHLWLVGGRGAFDIEHHGSRAVVHVHGVVIVDVPTGGGAGDVTVSVVGAGGAVEQHIVGLQVTNKMSVRAS